MRSVATGFLGLLLVLLPTGTSPPSSFETFGEAVDNTLHLLGRASGDLPLGGDRTAGPRYDYVRLPLIICGTEPRTRAVMDRACVAGISDTPAVRTCEDGSTALDPLLRREVDAVTGEPLTDWVQVDTGGCPEDGTPDVVLTAEEFRRLPLVPRQPVIQPSDGRALVTKGIVTHASPDPQELTTTLLGVPVTVRAIPVSYTWDFGDGSAPVVTTAAGSPYPHHAAHGEYPVPGTYEIRLTTAWRGEFQVDGAGAWRAVVGTATTVSDPTTVTVETAPARLYADR